MNDLDSNAPIKNHEKIIQMIDEIREFESIENDLKIEEKKKKEDIIEIEHKVLEHEEEILESREKKKFFDELRHVHFTTHPNKNNKVEKMIIPSTFKVGFNENGNLVNLNLKKKKEVQKKNKFLKIKNLIKRKKVKETEKEDESSKEESSSKIGKLKSKFGAIGKLKNVIPKKSKNKEEPKEVISSEQWYIFNDKPKMYYDKLS